MNDGVIGIVFSLVYVSLKEFGVVGSDTNTWGICGRCTGVAVPLRVVPSPPGLPSRRGPGLGSFSRAD